MLRRMKQGCSQVAGVESDIGVEAETGLLLLLQTEADSTVLSNVDIFQNWS